MDPTTEAQQLLRESRLDEALASVQQAIRKAPGDPALRTSLFALYGIIGQWEKALSQLQILGSLDPESVVFAQAYRPVVQCQLLREEVFAGKRTPLVLGEPYPWLSNLIQANAMIGSGNLEAGIDLQAEALEEAPESPGTVDGKPIPWIADADTRLGPVLEVILEGKYYWIPFARIRSIRMNPPSQLSDLIWATANFQWTNEGGSVGMIPVLYPGTEKFADSALKLARKTEWREAAEGLYLGIGQKMFTSGEADYPVLEVREITLEPLPEEAAHEHAEGES